MMERPGADSEEKHEPASDIDIALMDSLKVLDPEGPIREADICKGTSRQRFIPSRAPRPLQGGKQTDLDGGPWSDRVADCRKIQDVRRDDREEVENNGYLDKKGSGADMRTRVGGPHRDAL
jgi:hypothetical protein